MNIIVCLKQVPDTETQIKIAQDGKSIDDIASELFISRQTVGTHKTRLMRKLDLHNNIDIVRYALKHNIISF